MKHYLHLLAIGLFCGLMAALVAHRILSDGAPGGPAESVRAASEPTSTTSTTSNEALSQEMLSHVRPAEEIARVKELEKMELAKRQRDQAAEKTPMARARMQLYYQRAWTEVIRANRQKFEALREEAAQSPDKMVPCTICDAKGVLDLCVVCDHTGKCPTCHGTGRTAFDEVCPTCQGSGKCFLCFGAGKMPCPFCQSLPLRKEVITPATPDPAAEIPIN